MTGATEPAIPGFRILAVAGEGGMGTVYQAEQTLPRRLVAIKMLKGAGLGTADLAAFHREAEVIARLEHPHIVPLYAYGRHAGSAYLVLRFLSGGSVADRIRRGPVDLPSASRWLNSVADALDFAHGQGLIHKDVKPSNILLDEAGNAYLTDFGIAGTMEAVGGGTPLGSAAYMSPEQGRGEAVDARADIYALGVTLFEMLTGRKPYLAESAMGVIVRHINDPIPSARALDRSIPPAVDELIQWTMDKDPGGRPQTAGEFARLLAQAVLSPDAPLRPAEQTLAGASAVPAPPPARPNVFLWAGAALAAACVLGMAVLLGGGMLAAFFVPTQTVTPTSTVPPTLTAVPATPTPEGQLLADDFSDSTSGFAVTGEDDPDGGVSYAGGALQIVVRTAGIEWFSPSGRLSALDVTIEADVLQASGPPGSELAVVCRWQDPDNYAAFAFGADGLFSIWRKRGGTVERMKDWTPAPALATGVGVPHRVRATCAGPTLRFEVDGRVLAEVADPDPAPGDVALMAGLREPGELLATFDNVRAAQP